MEKVLESFVYKKRYVRNTPPPPPPSTFKDIPANKMQLGGRSKRHTNIFPLTSGVTDSCVILLLLELYSFYPSNPVVC